MTGGARDPRSSSRNIPTPGRFAVLGEGAAILHLPGMLARAPGLLRAPRGDGAPVMLLPGFGTGDAAMALLRRYLGWLGHDARGWGLGMNTGNVARLLPRIVERVGGLARETGRPVRLVGWSLGGYLAREAARDAPDAVDRVVTLGAPVVGGPKYTLTARTYRERGVDLDAIEAAVDAREAVPLRRPVTAIYSRRDPVVSWQACIDERNGCVEHVEVRATHLGFVFSPQVFRLVAERLGA